MFEVYEDYTNHCYVIEFNDLQRRVSFHESDKHLEKVKQDMVREHRRITIAEILIDRKEKIEKILK